MESFVEVCKQIYYKGITPSNISSHHKEGYKRLVGIAKQYFDDYRYDEFASAFIEGQYLISLWTAHLLLEYGKPNKELTAAAIKIIENYSDNPLSPEVAKEEREWLKINAEKYKG